MSTPIFIESILRKPESILTLIQSVETNAEYTQLKELAVIVRICLSSHATNDYLEKIGAEAIGAKHLTDKLGPDGLLRENEYVEIKPYKKSPGIASVAVINDDTPMKLYNSHTKEKWLVLLCANESGTCIQYALCAPFHYWENSRYAGICKRLSLSLETGWAWDMTKLPEDLIERKKCLEDLLKKHQVNAYVRSNPLKLDPLNEIPRDQVSFWKHPDLPVKKLHPILQSLVNDITV